MDCRKYEPLFGSWYITEELGSGAEGSLYRICRTDALGHKYYSALKVVSVPEKESEIASLMAGGMSLDEVAGYFDSVLENTTQEFELLAKLKGNSNIVSYEDHEIFMHDNGIGWDILIRLEELTPLVRYSIDNPLTADEVARMGRDICRGLALCRRYGIVHRDIKPDNIFISPSGSYKLGDFGIARIIEKSTIGLSRKGTYEYMAPEVYWGRDYGASVDLYSLGMVMYRYLNDGRMPLMPPSPEVLHADDRETAFVRRMSGNEIPEPRCGSDELKRIVLKACAYERADRYRDAEEMLRELEKIVKDPYEELSEVSGEAGIATEEKEDRNEPAAAGKRGWKIFGILALLCALIGFGIWYAIPKEVEDIGVADAVSGAQIDGAAEVYIGDDLTLACTVTPDRFKDEPVTLISGNENVITVEKKEIMAGENGVLHALALGDASLTMTAKEYSEEISVSVVPKVTSIGGIDEKISLTTGDTQTLKPALAPDKFKDEPVTYKSGDKKVATVSKDGLLTAVAAGETTLTVTSGGCTFKASVSVSDPIVYYAPTTTYKSSKKTSSKSTKKKTSSSKGSKGYFDSSDDEHF
ncbi:MAG: protein kinase [Mogibacterium sp.]|nr:protein kinase [Mogibacterium sp.]